MPRYDDDVRKHIEDNLKKNWQMTAEYFLYAFFFFTDSYFDKWFVIKNETENRAKTELPALRSRFQLEIIRDSREVSELDIFSEILHFLAQLVQAESLLSEHPVATSQRAGTSQPRFRIWDLDSGGQWTPPGPDPVGAPYRLYTIAIDASLYGYRCCYTPVITYTGVRINLVAQLQRRNEKSNFPPRGTHLRSSFVIEFQRSLYHRALSRRIQGQGASLDSLLT